ncbi:hypothetical protein Pcinc_001970 [Petrolisthes cinctipes]|uniref:Uncharacterized protein n=1 Tax=Petrolisthes cinctipes TaxID=88211 RepID=A0AAE1L2Q6_PETCI|nr:hypothetical protein Pcinc_001970 [Petrolisthes cinctipes]
MPKQAGNAPPSFGQQPSTAADISIAIVEMEERKKRKDSLVFHDIRTNNLAEAKVQLSQITTAILGSDLSLDDVFCINKDKGIYKAKCTVKELRDNLLFKAKSLKDIPVYKGVYVNRNLTFTHRQELFIRRHKLGTGEGGAHSLSQVGKWTFWAGAG